MRFANRLGRVSACATGLSISLVIAWPALAASKADQSVESADPEVAPQAERSAALDQIVVVARRREENLQDVPVSVEVVDGRELAERNFNSLSDLSQVTSGVSVASGQNSNRLFIRGVGSGNNPSFDQSVATFVDGIYRGRSRSSEATFLDIDRIEILKGPQTTFFGNSAIAGALNILTKGPGDRLEAWGRVLYGRFGEYAVEGAVGGPISDTLGVRAAVSLTGGDGWVQNINSGQKVPSSSNKTGRLVFGFKPSDRLDMTLKIEAGEIKSKGSPFDLPLQWVNCPAPEPIGPNYPFALCDVALSLNLPIGLDNNLTPGLPGQGYQYKSFDTVFTVNYDIGDHTLTSITGYNNYKFPNRLDPYNLPLELATASNTERYKQFSQELRLASPKGENIEYLVGAYFQSDKLRTNFGANIPQLNDVFLLFGFNDLAPYFPIGQRNTSRQTERIYSIFGAITVNATPSFRLNVGARGTRVKKTFEGSRRFVSGTELYPPASEPLPPQLEQLAAVLLGPPMTTDPASVSDTGFMGNVDLQYDIDPTMMAYISYRRGFKSGGFNALDPFTENGGLRSYGPEHVNAFEVGLKSQLFNDTVRLNVAAFRSDYSGLQVSSVRLLPTTGLPDQLITNASRSRSQGVEVEAQWAVSDEFMLSANMTYLDARYRHYPDAQQTALQAFCASNYVLPRCGVYPLPVPLVSDRSGQRLDFSPRFSASAGASYNMQLGGGYELGTELNAFFTTRYNDQDPDLPGTPSYLRLDGRISLASPGGQWTLDVIGKNLTNQSVLSSLLIAPSLAAKIKPRTFAIQIRYNYQ